MLTTLVAPIAPADLHHAPALSSPRVRRAFGLEGLQAHRLFESSDLDETRERISRIMQPHRLIPGTERHKPAAPRSHMDFIKLGGSGLGTIGFGETMNVEVDALDNYYLLMFCTSGGATVRSMGRSIVVDNRHGILCPPGEPFRATLSPDCEQLVMRIDPQTLLTETGKRAGNLVSTVQISSTALAGWRQQLQLLINSRDMVNAAYANPRLGGQIEQLLISLFAMGHFTPGDVSASAPTALPGFVKRAETFMHEQCRSDLTLEDITKALDMPARTLQQAFKQFKGVTPMQYLKELRLDLAHNALARASVSSNVAEIAMACGFSHLGRFSLSYKARFGESPSTTLARR